ncbi:MAG TPA: carboxypeptidase regulatory-like domain-containing protein [Candidatus Angelobacter sp.]|nr:carboxypeptidase regulatory-like domain-containing protein [Candidatus Angelobacter sp.]
MRGQTRSQFIRLITVISAMLFLFSTWVSAQSARAKIIGTIKDPGGAVVQGARVTVKNIATGVSNTTTSDENGSYQVLELPIGSYRVTVEKNGFAIARTEAYTLEINQAQRIDVTLKVGGNQETVEVTGEAAQVEVVNPTLGASVTGNVIVNMPLNGRNVLDLATLQPGVTPDNPDDTGAGTFNIAGARADSVTFLLDGGVDNNLLSNGVVFTPNPDAVQEFRILTSNYTAEYGRNAGGIISIVTKSGTNQIHGSAFEFNRNSAFSANSYFNNKNQLPKDFLSRNQFGFTAGGPIVKDKLFWFTSYQGQRQTRGATNQVDTFTPDMLAGNFSHAGPGGGPDPGVVNFLLNNPFYQPNNALALNGVIDPTRIDPVAQKYIAAGLITKSPTNTYSCPSTSVCSGIAFNQANATNNNNEFTGKIDYNLSANDHISATAGGIRGYNTNPFQTGPGYPVEFIAHNYFSSLTYTHTFTTNLLNEFHFTLQRNVNQNAIPLSNLPIPAALGVGVTPDQATGPTRMSFGGGATNALLAGFSSQGPTSLANNTFSYSDTVSWVKGHHTWKFGGSFTPYQNNTLFDFFVNGQFDFDNFNGSGNQFANFLMGLPEDYFQFGSAPSNIRQKSTYLFTQDEWHVLRNLVLTLGVRYEYSEPKLDTQGRSFSIIPGLHSTRFINAPTSLVFPGDPGAPKGSNFPDKNDWAPRFGFAWDPTGSGKTSLRGGLGLFYDVLKGEDNLQFNGQAPFFGFTNPFFTDCPNGTGSGNPGCVTSNPGFTTDPFGTTGTVNPFPSKPPTRNIDFAAAGFLPFGGGGVFFVDPHLRTPYIWQYNVDLERELVRNLALEVGYLGSQSRKLTTLTDINAFDPATLSSTPHRFLNEMGTVDDGRFSFTPEFINGVNAGYHALQTKLSKKPSDTKFLGNTFFTFAYTWSHSIDNSSGFRNRNSQIPFFERNIFRASSDFDVRHQLSFSGGWELPFDHYWESGPKRLTKGWNIFPILFWHTGFPLDVNAGLLARRTNPGPSGAGDANLVTATLTGPIIYFNPHNATPGTPGNQFFEPNFAAPDPNVITGSYGSGRNILRGPGRVNLDMAFTKTTKITEHTAIELRAEFFNIFNHAEFSNPDTNLANLTFGQITSTADPRIIQFGTRFTF